MMRKFLYSVIALTSCIAVIGLFSKRNTPTIDSCRNCNIVLIVIDTLRSDYLPFYGYHFDTAPFLSTLAAKSTVFEKAYSASSWTAPATASIFTSLYPSQHGVITGYAATKQLQEQNPNIQLNHIPHDITVLGDYMNSAGFTTIGVADNLNIGRKMGFARGFESFKKFKNEGAAQVNLKASEFLDSTRTSSEEKPYFLYLHYMDPHAPYEKKDPWYSECMAQQKSTQKEIATKCAYSSEIRYVDSHIQSLVEKYDLLKNSVIMITSDHGEEFGEHGYKGHGHSLYREVIQVPLLIYHPHYPARRIERKVTTMDILPTVASLLDRKLEPQWQGRSLYPFLKGEPAWKESRIILSERLRAEEKPEPEFRSLIQRPWHYIQTEKRKQTLKQELFDLEKDPNEQKNQAIVQSGYTVEYAARLKKEYTFNAISSEHTGVDVRLDEKLLKQLESLGYLN